LNHSCQELFKPFGHIARIFLAKDKMTGQCKGFAFVNYYRKQDGSKWTSDGHANSIKITAHEAQAIGAAFKGKNWSTFQSSGILLEGVKYQFLRTEDDKIALGKKKDMGAVTLHASKTAVVIAHTKEGSQHGTTNKGVAVIGDYLETLNM